MKAEGFGYKNAWVAFKTEDAAAVAKALSLRNLRPSDWPRGVAAAYEYPFGCSVFVTPPIDGWVLCVGFSLFSAVDARPPTFGKQALRLSRNGGSPFRSSIPHVRKPSRTVTGSVGISRTLMRVTS